MSNPDYDWLNTEECITLIILVVIVILIVLYYIAGGSLR